MEMTTDPVLFLDQLQPDAIRERLVELERQSRALRVLLRAAVARERQDLRRRAVNTPPAGEADCA
jgi:hypothetical protein